jgi:hypothetical protein
MVIKTKLALLRSSHRSELRRRMNRSAGTSAKFRFRSGHAQGANGRVTHVTGLREEDPRPGLASGNGVLEGCDAPPGEYKKPQSFCIMLRPQNAVEADRIFNTLAQGGTVQIPLGETIWALRFGFVVDRFGMPWLINCEKPAA